MPSLSRGRVRRTAAAHEVLRSSAGNLERFGSSSSESGLLSPVRAGRFEVIKLVVTLGDDGRIGEARTDLLRDYPARWFRAEPAAHFRRQDD